MLNKKKLFKSMFFKNSILYTFGSMMTPMIGFIMLPIYTFYLSPSEYGIMTTVQTLVGLFELILMLSLHSAVTRFYYDFLDQPDKQKEYLGSIFIFVLLFSTVSAIIFLLLKDSIGALLFQNIPINPFYYYLIGLSWASCLISLPMALFRAQEKAGSFVAINCIKSILIMLVTIYLVVNRGLGAEAALISQFIVTLIVVFLTFYMQYKNIRISLNILYVKQSLIFSIPLLPHLASGWIIKSSDRVILEKFVDAEDLGIYALAVQVSMILTLFYTSINNALIPRYTSLRKEGKEHKAKKLLKIFSFVIVIFGIVSIPIAIIGIKILASSEYNSAVSILPVLLIGQIIKGFYYIPVAKLYFVKKTGAIATSSLLAATISIGINLMAIPYIGIYGAIISSITADFIRYLLIHNASKKAQIKIQNEA